jgi:DnaJ-class molecular chaperone
LNHYEILQVDQRAEPEVIEAAYRRLMRKYHPDVLDTDQREDPEIQRRIRQINEAYEILHDPISRAAYDEELRRGSNGSALQLEKREYTAKCGRTHRSFGVKLARRKETSEPFRVVGIGPVNDDGKKAFGFISKFLGIFHRRNVSRLSDQSDLDSNALEELFDETKSLDFGNINWGGYRCPVCRREFVHPDGGRSAWGVCSNCGGLYCAGGIRRTRVGSVVNCPWCGSKRRVTFRVRPGEKSHKYVSGRQKTLEDSTALTGNHRKKLPPAS